MRFTRKIPGIRPAAPGQRDEAAPVLEILSPSWISALTFIVLLALVGVFLFCTLEVGGYLSYFWLEPRVLGLSTYVIASGINALLMLLLLINFRLALKAGPRRNLKRAACYFIGLGLLVCVQVFLNGWKETAERDREDSQVDLQGQVEQVRVLREEIAQVGEHPWSGEYLGRLDGFEVHLLLAPGLAAGKLHVTDGYSEELPFHERFERYQLLEMELTITDSRLVLEYPYAQPRRRPQPDRYAVVQWGSRRYLVAGDELEEFLAAADPIESEGVYLRLGDESKPLEGRPEVVQGLR